jgi:uncharacterized protein YqfA (UPF0365 family)
MTHLLTVVLPCVICGLLAGFLVGFGLLRLSFWRVYFKGVSSGVPLSFSRLLHLYLGRVRFEPIYNAYFTLSSHGLPADIDRIIAHHQAGGDVMAVASATAAAAQAKLSVTFSQLCALDLSGGDVMKSVQERIEPSIFHADQQFQGIRVGHGGRAVTNVGMAGQAVIEGKPVRVISHKGLIHANNELRVVSIDGSILTVEGVGLAPA